MTGLWLSKSRQGWGRCRTTRSPRVPDASSGVSRGPHNSDFGWGRRQAMGGKVARAPRYASLLGVSGLSGRRYSGRAGCVRLSSLNTYAAPIVRVAGIGHPCYPVPVTTSLPTSPQLPTIHYPLPTTPYRPVPPQIGRAVHPASRFPSRCSTRQIQTEQNGTLWNGLHRRDDPSRPRVRGAESSAIHYPLFTIHCPEPRLRERDGSR